MLSLYVTGDVGGSERDVNRWVNEVKRAVFPFVFSRILAGNGKTIIKRKKKKLPLI